MDLGLKWLMYDFHPASTKRNTLNGWRMLILDGHNSHCSYPFVNFCEKHQIVLLCLPSHTTHQLQPCDVGVFGPLALSWKSEVNKASKENVAITKYNLLELYAQARTQAFTSSTIQSAFHKTGIWLFDPLVIEESAFTPALNTTMQPAQPVPTTLPALLQACQDAENSSHDEEGSEADHQQAAYTLLAFPSPLRHNTSHVAYIGQNQKLREFAERAKAQMEADYASRKLMDAENGQLRVQLFGKKY